jgi:hypothetical protein
MSHYVRDITLFNQNISSVYHIVHCTCDLNIMNTRIETSVSSSPECDIKQNPPTYPAEGNTRHKFPIIIKPQSKGSNHQIIARKQNQRTRGQNQSTKPKKFTFPQIMDAKATDPNQINSKLQES